MIFALKKDTFDSSNEYTKLNLIHLYQKHANVSV